MTTAIGQEPKIDTEKKGLERARAERRKPRPSRWTRTHAQKVKDPMPSFPNSLPSIPWICRCLIVGLAVVLLLGGAAVPQSVNSGGSEHLSDEWITVNKDYSSQRYVDLDQITPANVSQLKEVCEIQINEPVWFTGGLLKVGRTLYLTTLRGTYAFDAVNCQLRWKKVIDFQQVPASTNQRGAVVSGRADFPWDRRRPGSGA